MIQRIKAASEILKAPSFRASSVTSRGYKHQFWQLRHAKARDALKGCSNKNTRDLHRFGADDKMIHKNKESQIARGWTDAWVRDVDHIAEIDISHTAPAAQRGRYQNLLYLRAVGENLQGLSLEKRPGYQQAKTVLMNMQAQSRKDMGVESIPKSAKKRLNGNLILTHKGPFSG